MVGALDVLITAHQVNVAIVFAPLSPKIPLAHPLAYCSQHQGIGYIVTLQEGGVQLTQGGAAKFAGDRHHPHL